MAITQETDSSRKTAVHVKLTPEAYDKIEAAARANKRGRGPEIAFRIEEQLRQESEGGK